MNTYKQNTESIISDFRLFEDWMDKYNFLIELGKSLPLIDSRLKTDNYLINGCQSQVWLFAEYKDGAVIFTADSDAIITKGIVNVLIRALSGLNPSEIIEADMNFIDEIGLREHLSPTRSNGLSAMIKQMKLYALVYKAKYGNLIENMTKETIQAQIIENLRNVYDPEIPVNVYDLGLIYNIDISDDFGVTIQMTLTSPNCPVAETLPINVRDAAASVRGVVSVYVDLVFEPEWSQDLMTEAAKLELGLL